MPRVRAPRVLHQGPCTARDCSVSRKKRKSAERLKKHDLRCAGIRIVEQFLGFIRQSCSWLACSLMACYSSLMPLLPSHCKSRCWLFPVGITCLPSQVCEGHRASSAEGPLRPAAAGDKKHSKGSSDLWNKHKSLCSQLKDAKE